MYSKYFDKLQAIIIPHAGIQYAGTARKKNIYSKVLHQLHQGKYSRISQYLYFTNRF